MNEYIKRLRVLDENGNPQDKQIDYNALANLPESLPANGGHANTADNANHAQQADNAEHANTANNAEWAENAAATDSAEYAKIADWAASASVAEEAHFDAYGNAFIYTYATKEDLANLVDSSPEALDTLNELAQALGNDPNFATTVLETLGNKENKSVYQKTMIYSENWDENQYYSFEDLYPSAQWDFEIFLDGQQTTEEIKESYNDAEIIGGYNENKIKAFGVVPTIDIPIIIKAVEK